MVGIIALDRFLEGQGSNPDWREAPTAALVGGILSGHEITNYQRYPPFVMGSGNGAGCGYGTGIDSGHYPMEGSFRDSMANIRFDTFRPPASQRPDMLEQWRLSQARRLIADFNKQLNAVRRGLAWG